MAAAEDAKHQVFQCYVMILQSARIQEYIFAGMTLKESKPKQRRGFVQFCSAAPEILSTGSLWADCTRPSCKNTIQIQIWIVNLSNKAIELFPAVMQQAKHMLKFGPIFSSGHAAFLTIGLYSSKGCYKVHGTICDLLNTRSPCAFAEEYK